MQIRLQTKAQVRTLGVRRGKNMGGNIDNSFGDYTLSYKNACVLRGVCFIIESYYAIN